VLRSRIPVAEAGKGEIRLHKTLRLVIVGDRSLAEDLAERLQGTPSAEVVGVAHDATEAYEAASTLRPDVVMVEVDRLGQTAVDAVRRLGELDPSPRIVVLAKPGSTNLRRCAEAAEVDAYVATDHAASVTGLVLGLVAKQTQG
jgi:two-component system nitrate/nitrite response regulator NarL